MIRIAAPSRRTLSPATRVLLPARARSSGAIGDFFSDAWNALTHPADTAAQAWQIAIHPADDVNTVINAGPQWFFDQVRNVTYFAGDVAKFVGKGFEDFARSSIGQNLLTIATSALYMTLAPIIGPLALLTFAFPGLAQGDDFGNALLQGFIGQTQRALSALTGGNADVDILPADLQKQVYDLSSQIHSQVGTALGYLQQAGIPDLSTITYEGLAQQLQIRVDAAAAALVHARGNPAELAQYSRLNFDPRTGALQNSIPNAQGVAGGAAFARPLNKVELLPVTRQAVAAGALQRSTALEQSLVKALAAPVVQPSGVVASSIAASVKALAPASSLSAGEMVAIGGAVLVVGGGLYLWLGKSKSRRR